jgi:hypothetical protein
LLSKPDTPESLDFSVDDVVVEEGVGEGVEVVINVFGVDGTV